MADEFFSLTMLLEHAADEEVSTGHVWRAFFLAACAVVISREENA